uniref:Uncharacterized protein n=1 Tax=Rhizophora mucronata TaxID=61149 RepID=A0A2P2Q0A2_RHIMU
MCISFHHVIFRQCREAQCLVLFTIHYSLFI